MIIYYLLTKNNYMDVLQLFLEKTTNCTSNPYLHNYFVLTCMSDVAETTDRRKKTIIEYAH